MGEYADEMIDSLIEHYGYPPPPRDVTCKFCGKRGLRWHEAGGGWVLKTKRGGEHNCRVASPDDFDDVSGG